MSSVDEIKRIRGKTFCFNVQLRPNPRTQHTKCIHRAGCNSIESRGIRMSEFPPLLLRKRATTSPLSQNLFCQLQAKGEWLIILESLKRKNKQGQRPQPSTKKIKGLLRAQTTKPKRVLLRSWKIYICGVHLGALASNFSGWLAPLIFSISISTCSGEALALKWPWSLPLLLCLHVQFPWDMCTSLYDVSACSIPSRYVHKSCLFWPTKES